MAHHLKTLAMRFIGLFSPDNELELIQILTMMRLYDKQIIVIDQEVSQLMAVLNEATILTSVTGISNRSGGVILAEGNNINNFHSPDQLLALTGLEPSVYQSEQMNATGKMVKSRSTAWRWMLFQATEYASCWLSTLRQYRQKKLDEGKHYYAVMTHVAKKLVRIIYYLLKHHHYYDEFKLL